MSSFSSKLVIAAAIAIGGLSPRLAAADVILSQPAPAPPENGFSLLSSTSFAVGFDDFKLPQADTITSVQWVGFNSLSPGASFTISFTTDSSPGSFFPNTTPFITETVTPTIATYTSEEDEFTAVLPQSVSLDAGTDYWISIYEPNEFWGWISATAAPDPGALPPGAAFDLVGGTRPAFIGIDLNFTLIGQPTSQSVPEPASLALFGAGLASLIVLRRRQRGQA